MVTRKQCPPSFSILFAYVTALIVAGGDKPLAEGVPEALLGTSQGAEHAALLRWAQDRGVLVSASINLAASPKDARDWGMRAVSPVEKGDVLVRTPRELALPQAYTKDSRLAGEIPELVTVYPLLALSIAQEMERHARFGDSLWGAYVDRLGSLSFDSMPYRQRKDKLDWLWPSPLYYRASYVQNWTEAPPGQHPSMNRSLVVHAATCVSSRMHATGSSGEGSGLLPVLDMFNHAPRSNSALSVSEGSFSLQALRAIPAGEEITVSYGDKCNPVHFDSYGFTFPPWEEKSPCFGLYDSIGPDGAPSLPRVADGGNPDLWLSIPGSSGRTLLTKEIADFVSREEGFLLLNTFVRMYVYHYDMDGRIAPLRAQWRANRQRDPSSNVWWAPLDDCAGRASTGRPQEGTADAEDGTDTQEEAARQCATAHDASDKLAGGSAWLRDVLRVKMSEYVCLAAYAEMFDFFSGLRGLENMTASASALTRAFQVHMSLLESDKLIRKRRQAREIAAHSASLRATCMWFMAATILALVVVRRGGARALLSRCLGSALKSLG